MTYVGLAKLVRQGGVAFNFTNRLEVQKESRELLLEAIEKQIPKKPIAEKIWYNDIEPSYIYYCPICNKLQVMPFFQISYCNECGQKIDWSDEDENK